MTPEDMRQKAIDLFKKRMHWSQAILAVGQEKLNIKDQSAIKAVGAFGGGIASSGSTCGTLLGGVALISNVYSRSNPAEKEDPRMWSLSQKFVYDFEELTRHCDSTNCRDIAGVDWTDKHAVKDYYTNPDSSRSTCIKLVGDAAFALGMIIEKEGVVYKS